MVPSGHDQRPLSQMGSSASVSQMRSRTRTAHTGPSPAHAAASRSGTSKVKSASTSAPLSNHDAGRSGDESVTAASLASGPFGVEQPIRHAIDERKKITDKALRRDRAELFIIESSWR
jgi:hypothetical protein